MLKIVHAFSVDFTPRHPDDVKELDELSTFAGSLALPHHLEHPPSPCQRTKPPETGEKTPLKSGMLFQARLDGARANRL